MRYVIDMAEIATFQELQDADADRRVSTDERQAYVDRTGKSLAARLTATLNGTSLAWQVESSNLTAPSDLLPPSAGPSAQTLRIVLDLRAEFHTPLSTENTIHYADGNYPARTGWKEIVVEGDEDIRLLRSSASRKDLSRELTAYPPSVSAPPQDVTAEFTFVTGARAGWRGILGRFREEDALWLIVIGAGLSLFVRWRATRTRAESRREPPPGLKTG
ncbi:MAG: hypothetical protein EXQ48_08980 [Acidobacteria bacterium]|nr:hypothetical protein [Acidobacteriota bacterium]